MLNFEQEVELAKKLDIWTISTDELKAVDLISKGLPAAYVYEPKRGGSQVIVGNDGKVLIFASYISVDTAVEHIKDHKLWEWAKLPTRTIVCPSCGELQELDINMFPVNKKCNYVCDKCGSSVTLKEDMRDGILDKYFYVTAKDPYWENMCKKIAIQLWDSLGELPSADKLEYILSLSANEINEIMQELDKRGIKLSGSDYIQQSLINLFKSACNRIADDLKYSGMPGLR